MLQGNYIGTQGNGTSALGNSGYGVYISGSGASIGGTGAAILIAYNGSDGVRVDGSSATGNTIRGNSIHSNSGKGIETINGGNGNLAPPVITGGGSASGTACANCAVEVYSDSVNEGRISTAGRPLMAAAIGATPGP